MKHHVIAVLFFFVQLLLFGCGGSGTENTVSEPTLPPVEVPPSETPPVDIPPSDVPVVTHIPQNKIIKAYFRDTDGNENEIGGTIVIERSTHTEEPQQAASTLSLFWLNDENENIGEAFLSTSKDNVYQVQIPSGTMVPEHATAIIAYPSNIIGKAIKGTKITFHDFTGNTALSGPGGNEFINWHYGDDRPSIHVKRIDAQNGICVFDNGLVSIIDMNNTIGHWEEQSNKAAKNQANDTLYPPFEYLCDTQPFNSYKAISDEYGVWTYSTINDAMFYGTLVYDMFLKYLGEPPLNDKIRIRLHYDYLSATKAFWDGAYANFSDAYPLQYSMASLDAIAHEVAHGVLNRISTVDFYQYELSHDARTAHEAFGDISGVMAKYELSKTTEHWIHGQESAIDGTHGFLRYLNEITTESGAIASFLDYDDAGDNYYQRIGMLTYPFYLLAQQWGLEATYQIYLNAAKHCWTANMTLPQAATCIQQQTAVAKLNENDVINAFKAVKIKLFSDGVLSHFFVDINNSNITLTDNSQSTSHITSWQWSFGDNSEAVHVQNPSHHFNAAGEYNIRLTVQDSNGYTDSFSRKITISETPANE